MAALVVFSSEIAHEKGTIAEESSLDRRVSGPGRLVEGAHVACFVAVAAWVVTGAARPQKNGKDVGRCLDIHVVGGEMLAGPSGGPEW